MRRIVSSEQDMRLYGESFGRKLKSGRVLALQGLLGTGKTTFVKGLARGLGIRHKIKSPTFVIFYTYPIPKSPLTFYHFDLYRLRATSELRDLGFKEIVNHPDHIVAIEWPEKAQMILPAKHATINFSHARGQSNKRIVTIAP
jgi:tRNA threonylcarbamoyladenosine biosynthesis protein TsaE